MYNINSKSIIEFIYNSNAIEGNKINVPTIEHIIKNLFEYRDVVRKDNKEKYVYILETKVSMEHLIETVNYIEGVEYVLCNVENNLTSNYIKILHYLCRRDTVDKHLQYPIGAYKKYPNIVGNSITSDPTQVSNHMINLLNRYHKNIRNDISYMEICKILLKFHVDFEKIHPFQDGNGRVGRLILLKECLKYGKGNHNPLIIFDDTKMLYYNILRYNDKSNFTLETFIDIQLSKLSLIILDSKDLTDFDKLNSELIKLNIKSKSEDLHDKFKKLEYNNLLTKYINFTKNNTSKERE